MVSYGKLEILSMSDIGQYDNIVNVSLIVTCPHDVEGNTKSIIFKNSKSTAEKVLHDKNGVQKVKYDMEMYLINNVKYVPFNNQYFVLDIVDEEGDRVNFEVTMSEEIKNRFELKSKSAEKHTWLYIGCIRIESVLKYMVLPYCLTILLQLVHRVRYEGRGEWIGICATLILGDIALFFTLPSTNKFTFLERSLFLNLFFKLIISLLNYFVNRLYFNYEEYEERYEQENETKNQITNYNYNYYGSCSSNDYSNSSSSYNEIWDWDIKKYDSLDPTDGIIWFFVTFVLFGYCIYFYYMSKRMLDNNGDWKKGIIDK